MTQNTNFNRLELELQKSQDEIIILRNNLSILNARLDVKPIEVEIKDKIEQPKSSSLSGVIKDELFFVSSLILFVGIISTENYYQTFNIKYQFLNLPVFHIIYRGLTAVIANPALVFPYFVAVGWLVLDGLAAKRNWNKFLQYQRPLAYLLMFLVLLGTYPLARRSGRIEAEVDLRSESSTLPIINKLEAKGFSETEKEMFENQYRLLMIDSDYIIYFKPLKKDQTETIPIIHRLPKGEVYVLDTNK